MPVFTYKAKKENAQTVSGDITARDGEEAVDLLARQGFVPVSVEERASPRGGLVKDIKSSPVRPRDMLLFTRQLVGLLKSGVPLLQAIEVLGRQTRKAYFARVLTEVSAGIRNGRSFSSMLADYPVVFSPLFVTMARAGEESGRLRELLSSMTGYFRKQDEISSRIRGALAYPCLMLVVGCLTVFFILTFVMPKIAVLFDGLNTALPWPTMFIMGLSRLLVKAWPVLLVIVLAGMIAVRTFDQALRLRQVLSQVVGLFPFIRDFMLKVEIERFARTLGLLLESGIPILKALEVAIPTVSDAGLKKSLIVVQQSVAGGDSFGGALRELNFLPEMFAQLVTVGEESGELSATLKDIADTYEGDIAETTRTLMALLEPLMILLVGTVVGFIVFAMLLPIFQMDIFAR